MIFNQTKVLIDTRKVSREKQSADYTDHELVLETLKGNEMAYQVLMERYQYQLFIYALRTLNFHKENADEVSAEAWIKLYNNLANYKPEHSFRSWAYRITHNCCIDFVRRNKRFATTAITESNENNWSHVVDFDRPDMEQVERALNRLKPAEKELLLMYYMQELTLDEMSSKLKVPKRALSVKLSRIRKKAQMVFKD